MVEFPHMYANTLIALRPKKIIIWLKENDQKPYPILIMGTIHLRVVILCFFYSNKHISSSVYKSILRH